MWHSFSSTVSSVQVEIYVCCWYKIIFLEQYSDKLAILFSRSFQLLNQPVGLSGIIPLRFLVNTMMHAFLNDWRLVYRGGVSAPFISRTSDSNQYSCLHRLCLTLFSLFAHNCDRKGIFMLQIYFLLFYLHNCSGCVYEAATGPLLISFTRHRLCRHCVTPLELANYTVCTVTL